MVIYILEPYLNDSHAHWLKGLEKHLEAEVRSFTLPAKHWKWRMHASAITFSELLKYEPEPDHILLSDMSSAALLKSLLPPTWKSYKLSVYFHENQITYPWHERDQDVVKERNNHYGFINYTSALVADHVFFNSKYHLNVFTEALPEFLDQFPDHKNKSSISQITEKCSVAPIGIEASTNYNPEKWTDTIPTILWNHRWEYDKNPEDFFKTLLEMKEKGLEFKLIVLGRHGKVYPDIFKEAKEKLTDFISHWEYANSRLDYEALMAQAHLLPVTSNQDFFGVSALEAISSGVYPLLPLRLAFPEHLNETIPYYKSNLDLSELLEEFLRNWKRYSPILKTKSQEYAQEISTKYQWKEICAILMEELNSI
ncbi:MAG: DUF3524 domain-containing protein [Flavobacteriales bacterium]